MKPMRSVNPYTLQEIAVYEPHSEEVWNIKVAEAASAHQTWKRRSVSERLFFVSRLKALLLAQQDEFALLMTVEMGKRLSESKAEIQKCAALCAFYESESFEFLAGETIITDAKHSGYFYEPLGVVLGIMPWNFPFWQAFRFLVPALLAGNTVLLKHASNVSGCALAIERLFAQAQFPMGCMQTLLLPGAEVLGVLAHPQIAAVSITGSEMAGQQVAVAAASLFKPAVLELGGSDPFMVFEDADLEHAADVALVSRFQNSGQSCIAAKRFLVQESVYERFVTLFENRVRNLSLGDPALDSTTQAPLAREEFVAELDAQVQRCVEMGAVVKCGGRVWQKHPGFYEPTILTDIKPEMPAAKEELFGPVAAIFSFKEAEEATQLANNTRFGLGSTVFTFNEHLIQLCKNELRAGSVFINGLMKSHPALPFGGIKASGYGRELGRAGVQAFCQVKTYWMNS